MLRGWLRKQTWQPCLVHTNDDQTIQGVLSVTAPDGIVLVSAVYLDGAGNGEIPLSGSLWIPRETIRFVQMVRG